MTLPPGTQFGPYRVVAPIGAGGMGEVYRGVDTRLDRAVAIKVLPQRLSQNPTVRERFEREARAVSAISHPHICTLFDVGRQDGTDYLVMEFLEGETLADRLSRGPVPVEQALRYGIQIADALDKAHRHGVIHRDLKPGNIMITKSGAKLLDFGLAKYAVNPELGTRNSELTVHKPLTEEGTILGTFQYMAPEQLEGAEADARTDIFALGAVLYEMITGRRAFEGKNRTSLIAAIVSGDPPPINSLQPLSPLALERVIRTCLAKDPEDRWQTAHDVALELKWITSEHSQPAARAERSTRRRIIRHLPWIIAAVAIIAAAALAVLSLRHKQPAPRRLRLQLTYPAGARMTGFSVSPDGRRVATFLAFPDKLVINVRSLDGTQNRDIPIGNPTSIFWSPDSQSIGFTSARKLMRMDLSGGPPQEICASDYGVGAVWTRDNTIVFAPRFGAGLFRVSAEGGTPELLTRLNPEQRESLHGWPAAVPGTDLVLFIRRTVAAERNQIHVISSAGGSPSKVLEADALTGATRRHVYFIRDGALYRQSFDAGTKQVAGKPERLVESVYFAEGWAAGAANLDSNGSTLAFVPYLPRKTALRRFDRIGKLIEELYSQDDLDSPQLSRDGRFVTSERWEPRHGAADVWTVDLTRKIEIRLTTSPGGDEDPQWTPDGRSVYFQSDRDGLYEPYIVPSNGSSEARRLMTHRGGDTYLRDWSRDGSTLLLEVSDPKKSGDIWIAPASDPARATVFVSTAAEEQNPRFSPDGAWIAFSSDASGRAEIYIQNVRDRELRHQISTNGGFAARWSAKGDELFYISDDRLMAVSLARRGADIDAGIPRPLFPLPPKDGDKTFDPAPDGQTFVIPTFDQPQREQIEVIATWPPPDPE